MSDADQRLAKILDSLTDPSQGGTVPQKLQQAIRQHPDLRSEIEELAATVMVVDDVAALRNLDCSDTDPTQHEESADRQFRGSPTEAPGVGRRVGDYVLTEQLGRGGMGVVYRARQQSLQRDVAIKMIPHAEFAASDDVARLRLEALAAGQLSHPHVVPVYEVGEHAGIPWFCMKLVDGETLSDRLVSGRMDPRDAVRLLLPVVEAVHAAHTAGILHRDLKPSNILLDQQGTPFVTDFGLAKRTQATAESLSGSSATSDGGITRTGAILGTPAWMAPEQAAGQTDTISAAGDIYSLGAILYAMLSGRPPFQAATPFETLRMVIEQEPPALRVLVPRLDSDLEMIVTRCLQKPQDLRYETAADLAGDLRAWLNGEAVSARSSTLASVMTRLFRESHHASVLQNWGVLWMWHSLVLLILCLTTNAMQLSGVDSRWPYLGLWILGLGLWAFIFWNLRRRSGPVTAVERQIAHVWGGSMVASSLLFAVESLMNRPVLEFSPVLGAISGMVFLVKAGTLSGTFYIPAVALFLTSPVMAAIQQSELPNVSVSLFGVVSAATFFFPGLKYYRQQRASPVAANER